MTKTIVVLGAGMAGLPIAHYLLRKTATQHDDLRVVLVSPHDVFYWKIASVRFALPDQMPEDKYMYPLAAQFAPYAPGRFELVIGAAETLDPGRNTVGVRTTTTTATTTTDREEEEGAGALRGIEYHTLIVATGSRYRDDMPWKEVGTSAQTRASLASLRARIRDARSIVVAGAGLTGVEFAGELGSAYGKAGRKEITLVGAGELPLDEPIKRSVRETAERELAKLGVKYVGGARVEAKTKMSPEEEEEEEEEEGTTTRTVTLVRADGTTQTLKADLVVPTFGVVPNTSFAPEDMRDAATGCLRQGGDLRVPGHGNIFVVGDAGSLQPAQLANTDAQIRHLMTQLNAYLRGESIKPYVFDPDKTQVALTIGRDRGTGQVGSWQMWSVLVWLLKGRHLGTNSADTYARGDAGGMGRAWPK